jgi:hypothetical protein
MLRLFRPLFVLLARFVRSRRDLLLENLALRQQLAVLKKRHPQPRFMASDKIVLGDVTAALAGMEAVIDSFSAGDRRALAPGGIQVVLVVAFAASDPRGTKVRQQTIA